MTSARDLEVAAFPKLALITRTFTPAICDRSRIDFDRVFPVPNRGFINLAAGSLLSSGLANTISFRLPPYDSAKWVPCHFHPRIRTDSRCVVAMNVSIAPARDIIRFVLSGGPELFWNHCDVINPCRARRHDLVFLWLVPGAQRAYPRPLYRHSPHRYRGPIAPKNARHSDAGV